MGRNRPQMTKPRKPKNKSTKSFIEFDMSKRNEFLTGFRKRKQERKRKAQEKIKEDIKEEKRKAREKAKSDLQNPSDSSKNSSASHRVVPEIEHLLPSSVSQMGSHTVTVTHIDNLGNLVNGELNQNEKSEDSTSEKEEEQEKQEKLLSDESGSSLKKSDQRILNRLMQKKLQNSKAFKAAQKLKTQSAASQKLQKFSKKSGKSKRMRHHNPKKQAKTKK